MDKRRAALVEMLTRGGGDGLLGEIEDKVGKYARSQVKRVTGGAPVAGAAIGGGVEELIKREVEKQIRGALSGGGLVEDVEREVKRKIPDFVPLLKKATGGGVVEDVEADIKRRIRKGVDAAMGGGVVEDIEADVKRRVKKGIQAAAGGGIVEDIEEDVKRRIKKGARAAMGGSAMASVGDKDAVYNGEASHTPGGLTKKDLMISPSSGKVVSKKQYKTGKALAARFGRA